MGLVIVSQLLLAFGYYTIVKSIQEAHTVWNKCGYCAGGAAGACIGVLITQAIK